MRVPGFRSLLNPIVFRIDVLLVYFYTALLLVRSLSKISFIALKKGSSGAPFPKASAKVQPFSELTKLFMTFFRKIAFFMKYTTKCTQATPLYFIRARELDNGTGHSEKTDGRETDRKKLPLYGMAEHFT